jgi:hypothetical protein
MFDETRVQRASCNDALAPHRGLYSGYKYGSLVNKGETIIHIDTLMFSLSEENVFHPKSSPLVIYIRKPSCSEELQI